MTVQLKPIDQQVIVITGASSGIGLTTARAAIERGAKVVVAARSRKDLDVFVNEVGADRAVAVVADVADRLQVELITTIAIQTFGRVDTWVNNAGVSIYGRIEEISEDDNHRLFDTNFWGVVNGSLSALRHLKATGGALINIGSEVSDAVVPLQGMYSASKHAVKGFTDALRIELHAEGAPVSVTLIQPTAVNTPYPQHARNYQDQEAKLPDPMIDPSTVAKAILHAAEHHDRDVTVGMMAAINTTISKLMPTLGDRLAEKLIGNQQYDVPPRNPAGALHRAGGGGSTHGNPPSDMP